jgi:EAL domain-containing protein (putative c-di-GMP-specific phosphodiesterase class I)
MRPDAFVRAIISIEHNLKLGVIAKGIEETNQLEEPRNAGCNTAKDFSSPGRYPRKAFPNS